ncbi:MAG: DeoR/GlpR family DNA-binding transcription regulator [Anaerolineales bacterium]|jgi:DeoR/GlpR family transcriptional regulator of sugar metabolism
MLSERRRKIIEIVQESGSMTVADLCELFDVSEMTIRRDLRDLDKEGVLRRVHGGAVSNLGRSYEPPYTVRTTRHANNKAAIGQRAADLVVDGDSIALDVGTTTLEIARALKGKRNLTILTASIPIANEVVSNLSLNSDVRLILTGGIVRPGELSLIGNIAERTYDDFHVDKAFIGVGGLSLEDGLTEYNIEDARVKKPLIEHSRERIVVTDSSKLGQTTFSAVAPLSMVDKLVTDSNITDAFVRELTQRSIEVLIVNTD